MTRLTDSAPGDDRPASRPADPIEPADPARWGQLTDPTPPEPVTPPPTAPRGSSDDAYRKALEFLYDQINYEQMTAAAPKYRFRLRRMRELLERLGLSGYLHRPGSSAEPASRPPVPLVHVAGTKGKGSTTAMVAAMLTACGYRTGLYTSPHLHRLEERFRVDGRLSPEDEVVELVSELRPVAERLAAEFGSPSFFELTTAMALLHFHRQRCDAIVLEVGLGGRLDSTNVCHPSVTAITSIGLDHQHVLGDTLDEIAGEKAGIIKPGIPVVNGVRLASEAPAGENPAAVIRAKARQAGAPLFQLGQDFEFHSQPSTDWGTSLSFRSAQPPFTDLGPVELAIEGKHQAHNAAVAVAITQLLRGQGLTVPWDSALAALGAVQCAARIERFDLADGVLGILDASHNGDSIAALCATLRHRLAGRQVAIVFGTSQDKPAGPMLRQLAEIADRLILTRFHGNPRYVEPAVLRSAVPEGMTSVEQFDDPVEACQSARREVGPGGAVVVCGSFFIAAETRRWMENSEAGGCRTRVSSEAPEGEGPLAAKGS